MLSTKMPRFSCENCNYLTDKKTNYINHLESKRHEKNVSPQQMEDKQFYCEPCDFMCSKKSNYEKHLKTKKHNFPNPNINNINGTFVCKKCSSEYKSRSGLWKHIQKFHNNEQENEKDEHDHDDEGEPSKEPTPNLSNIITPELLMLLIQQNKDMQNIMMEQSKIVIEQNNSIMETMKKFATIMERK